MWKQLTAVNPGLPFLRILPERPNIVFKHPEEKDGIYDYTGIVKTYL